MPLSTLHQKQPQANCQHTTLTPKHRFLLCVNSSPRTCDLKKPIPKAPWLLTWVHMSQLDKIVVLLLLTPRCLLSLDRSKSRSVLRWVNLTHTASTLASLLPGDSIALYRFAEHIRTCAWLRPFDSLSRVGSGLQGCGLGFSGFAEGSWWLTFVSHFCIDLPLA